MEKWDLYTKDREKTGKEHIRGEELPNGCYHLVVHVWIRNSRGEYLISQRAADRPWGGLLWECVGGSVIKGEDSLAGALRESKEEIGIDLPPEQGRLLFSKLHGEKEGKGYFLDVWLFEYDGEPALEKATTDEVADSRWMTKEEIRQLYDAGKFVDSLGYFFH